MENVTHLKPSSIHEIMKSICNDPILYEKERFEHALICGLDYIPRNMSPNEKAFIKIGFKFENMPDKIFVRAKLPEGWYLKTEDDNIFYTDVFDNHDNKRAIITYIANHPVRPYSKITLIYRYTINIKEASVEVYDNKDNKILYEIVGISSKTVDKAYKDALHWLSLNYMWYSDPTKYWD